MDLFFSLFTEHPLKSNGDWEFRIFRLIPCQEAAGRARRSWDGFSTGVCWDELGWSHSPYSTQGTSTSPVHQGQSQGRWRGQRLPVLELAEVVGDAR